MQDTPLGDSCRYTGQEDVRVCVHQEKVESPDRESDKMLFVPM